MPTLNFPSPATEGQEWTDNDGVDWVFWRGAWVQVGGQSPLVSSVPAGMISAFGGILAPEGYLICDGSEVSRTDYDDLFNVIGDIYGDGDGLTTFNLPDLTSRTPSGAGNGHSLGDVAGAEEVTIAEGNMPAHSHSLTMNAVGGHSHKGSAARNGSHGHTGSTNSTGAHTHTLAVRSLNQNGGGNNQYIVSGGSITTSSNGNHSHSLTINSGGAHTHSLTINSGGGHTPTGTIGDTGGNAPIDVRQPTLYLNYIIKT